MNAFIDSMLTPLLLFMAEWSLRWAILAALPIGWLLLRPPRSSNLRYDLCLVTLAAGLALPLLPHWGGGIYGHEITSNQEPPASLEMVNPMPAFDTPPVRPIESPVVRDKVAIVETPFVQDLPAAQFEQNADKFDWWSFGRRGIVAALIATWLACASFLVVRWIAGAFYLRRLRRTAAPTDSFIENLLAACRQDLRIRRPVRLGLHPEVASPLTLGPWKPMILLPATWQELPLEQQRGSLLHELAHVQRRDYWIALLLHAVCVTFVFHPCVRWLRSRLECEREILCDEMALACGVDARAYALMLRDFASRTERLRWMTPALPFGQGPTVKRRIQRIMEEIMVPTRSVSRWIWCAAAVMVACSVAIGSLRIWAAAETPVNQSELVQDAPKSQEKVEQPTQPVIPKEQFKFGGKSFQQWQATLRSDLKPQVREEAFQALSTFGKNGYADEAARAILEIAATYDPTTDDNSDREVLYAAGEEIGRLGPLAIPALQDELLRGKTNGRRFAALVLKQMYARAKPAEAALIRALKDEDAFVRVQAAIGLAYFSTEKASSFVNAMVEVVAASFHPRKGQDEKEARKVLDTLAKIGKPAQAAVPALNELLKKPDPSGQFRFAIANTILELGGDPKLMATIYPSLLAVPIEAQMGSGPIVREYNSKVIKALTETGQEAKSAAPHLIARYHALPGYHKESLVDALMAIDAAPKELVPLIGDFLRRPGSPAPVESRERYIEYLKKQNVEVPGRGLGRRKAEMGRGAGSSREEPLSAAFSRLTDISETEEADGAVTRKISRANIQDVQKNRKILLQVEPNSGNRDFRVVQENSPVVIQAKVIKINAKDLIFQGNDKYYRISVGGTIKDALKNPLSKEELGREGIVQALGGKVGQEEGR